MVDANVIGPNLINCLLGSERLVSGEDRVLVLINCLLGSELDIYHTKSLL